MSDTSTPDYSSAEFQAFQKRWAKVDACLGGTEAMRASAGKDGESPYLPQFPLEHDDSYDYRLATSAFLPAYGDALDMIVGAITRKPPTLADVPPAIAADWENIDNAGTHWTVFAQRLLRSGAHIGAAYVLTEMPPKPEGTMDRSQSEAINFRPFAILYSAKELADWPRYVIVDGAPILQQIVFSEESVTLDGFGESSSPRYRVWRVPVEQDLQGSYHRAGNAEWEIWEEVETVTGKGRSKKTETKLQKVAGSSTELRDIPVRVFNANPDIDNPHKTDGPVLLNLANVNIKHYQLTSDHEKILHKCAPVLTTSGLKSDDDGGVASVAGLDVRLDCEQGGGAEFVEPPGTSLAERREWIAAIEKQMLEMGASLFAAGSEKQMTATEVSERAGAKQSRVSQLADAWKDCLEGVLADFATWKGEQSGGEITPGVKASDLVITPADLQTFSKMVEKGQHSLQTLWGIEQKLGVLPDDFDAEKELNRIAEEKKKLAAAAPELKPVQPVAAEPKQIGAAA